MPQINRSKRLIRNICQFVLGTIMLVMSYNYVQAHEAEKTNFTSGLTILRQKISNTFFALVGDGSAKDIDRQQEMLRNYKELSSYVKKSNCIVSISQNDIDARIASLETMSPSQYRLQSLAYSSFASQLYTEIQTKCKKESTLSQ